MRTREGVTDSLRQQIERSQLALLVEIGKLVEDVIGDLTSNPQPIDVRLHCEDRALAEQKASDVANLLASVRGGGDAKDGVVVSGPGVVVSGPKVRWFRRNAAAAARRRGGGGLCASAILLLVVLPALLVSFAVEPE